MVYLLTGFLPCTAVFCLFPECFPSDAKHDPLFSRLHNHVSLSLSWMLISLMLSPCIPSACMFSVLFNFDVYTLLNSLNGPTRPLCGDWLSVLCVGEVAHDDDDEDVPASVHGPDVGVLVRLYAIHTK